MDRIAKGALGPKGRPVRAVMFDKTAAINWAVGWHQDRTVVVVEHRSAPGYGPWTIKDGLIQVEPPFAVIDRMVTLRAHLDDCDEDNAPLMIVPGSHRLGRIPVGDVPEIVTAGPTKICEARRGDVWLYATAILHASEPARAPRRRRVLHVDYAADPLDHGLEWRGLL